MKRFLIVFAMCFPFISGCTIMLGGGGTAFPGNPVAAVAEAPVPSSNETAPVAENSVAPSESTAPAAVAPLMPFLPVRPSMSAVRPANPVGEVRIRPPSRNFRPVKPVEVCAECVRRDPPKARTPIRTTEPPRLIPRPKKTPPKPEPHRGSGPTRLASVS